VGIFFLVLAHLDWEIVVENKNQSDMFSRMKFPKDDIFILVICMVISGIGFFLYRFFKKREAVANLSVAAGSVDEQLVSLIKNFYEIGREGNPDMIKVNSKKASRQHAFINKKSGKFFITDNNSTNGTFINRKRIQPNQPFALSSQDEIKIGGVSLKFYDFHSDKI
jgi:hypothetical protein